MRIRVKIESIKNIEDFIRTIDGKNTLNLSSDELSLRLQEVFESKQKEQDRYNVPVALRENSIYVLLDDFKVKNWSIFNNMWEGDRTITFDSFKANDYKDTTPKFSKLFKIPVPNCYKNIEYSKDYIDIYKTEIQEFRNMLPEFNLWTDSQIVEFGNDYSQDVQMVSSFQGVFMADTMKDVALAMVLYDVELEEIDSDESWFNDKDYCCKGCLGLYNYLVVHKNGSYKCQ